MFRHQFRIRMGSRGSVECTGLGGYAWSIGNGSRELAVQGSLDASSIAVSRLWPITGACDATGNYLSKKESKSTDADTFLGSSPSPRPQHQGRQRRTHGRKGPVEMAGCYSKSLEDKESRGRVPSEEPSVMLRVDLVGACSHTSPQPCPGVSALIRTEPPRHP